MPTKSPVFVLPLAAALGLAACAPTLADDVDLMDVAPDDIAFVGEDPIYPNATIAQNIASAEGFAHLAMLIERTGLADRLGQDGPYTIFAPTNAAFDQVPAALRSELAKPENAERLRDIVAGHVVPGNISAADLAARIEAGGGRYVSKTLAGGELTFILNGEEIRIVSADRATVLVTQADLASSNGTIHVVDWVVLPQE